MSTVEMAFILELLVWIVEVEVQGVGTSTAACLARGNEKRKLRSSALGNMAGARCMVVR